MYFILYFQINLEETIIYKDLIRTEKLTVLSEKTLVGLLRSSSDQHLHIWAGLVADAFDKLLHAKELPSSKALLKMALSAKARARRWRERQKNDPKNRNIYKQKKKERYMSREKKSGKLKNVPQMTEREKEQSVKDGEQIKKRKGQRYYKFVI